MSTRTGIGTYLTELVPRVAALMDDARFTILGASDTLTERLRDVSRVSALAFDHPIYSISEQLRLVRCIPSDTALFWAPHYNIPLLYRGALAVTVHDAYPVAQPQLSAIRTFYANQLFAAVRRRASLVLCDSQFTASEFRRIVGEPRRLAVVPLGVAPEWFRVRAESSPLPVPYFLYVGNLKDHKNVPRLLTAFGRIADRVPHTLVLIGPRQGLRSWDPEVPRLLAGLGDRVHYTGHLPLPSLQRFVAACDALVLPSLYEGFGLPPLEAMACGRAVAVSRTASLPEVCGPYAEYFNPLEIGEIAAVLERLAVRPPDRGEDHAKRRAWARQFDWDTCAERTASALRACLHR